MLAVYMGVWQFIRARAKGIVGDIAGDGELATQQ